MNLEINRGVVSEDIVFFDIWGGALASICLVIQQTSFEVRQYLDANMHHAYTRSLQAYNIAPSLVSLRSLSKRLICDRMSINLALVTSEMIIRHESPSQPYNSPFGELTMNFRTILVGFSRWWASKHEPNFHFEVWIISPEIRSFGLGLFVSVSLFVAFAGLSSHWKLCNLPLVASQDENARSSRFVSGPVLCFKCPHGVSERSSWKYWNM